MLRAHGGEQGLVGLSEASGVLALVVGQQLRCLVDPVIGRLDRGPKRRRRLQPFAQ